MFPIGNIAKTTLMISMRHSSRYYLFAILSSRDIKSY